MSDKLYLDFDDKPLTLVEAAFSLARDAQQVRQNQCARNDKLYRGFLDMSTRDYDKPNIFIPKIFNIVETKVARDCQVVLGSRPWMPVDSNRKDFREIAEYQTELLDELANRGNFPRSFITMDRIKTLHGNAFIEPMPYFVNVTEKIPIPDPVTGMALNYMERDVPRLRIRFRVYAPWEIFVDPKATGLSEGEFCRYIIKFDIVDSKEIQQMYEEGAYGPSVGGDDIDPTDLRGVSASMVNNADHWGYTMLHDVGIIGGAVDDGTCILMRYESPERYIECLNGTHILRDVPNPFKHKRINLAKFDHRRSPHTQEQFWAMGEAKPNEILQTMLNDLWNQTLENHELTNQGMMLYREKGIVGGPDSLVRVPGNRIGISGGDDTKPLSNYVLDLPAQQLPRDHYMLPAAVERMMDLTSQSFNIQRGEAENDDKTLGEASMLKESGDSPMELNIRQIEYGLGDLADLCFYHIDQYGTMDDYAEVIGPEKAMEMRFANPHDLPGGFNFAFKGSDRVVNVLQRQRAWANIAPMLVQLPVIKPVGFAQRTMEIYELDDSDMDEIVMNEEEFQMQQQAMAMQQQAQMEQERRGQVEDSERQHSQNKEMEQIKGQQRAQKTSTGSVAQSAGRQAAQT